MSIEPCSTHDVCFPTTVGGFNHLPTEPGLGFRTSPCGSRTSPECYL